MGAIFEHIRIGKKQELHYYDGGTRCKCIARTVFTLPTKFLYSLETHCSQILLHVTKHMNSMVMVNFLYHRRN